MDQLVEQHHTLLIFCINNNGREDTNVKIRFNQVNRPNVNFRMPATEYCEIISNYKMHFGLRLCKLRLNQESWGDIFDFQVIIDGYDVETMERFDKYARDYNDLRQ